MNRSVASGLRMLAIAACAVLVNATAAWSEPTFTAVEPLTVRPGEKTPLVFRGKELADPIRFATSSPAATIQVDKVEPDVARATIILPPDAAPGPLGIWPVTAAGPGGPFVVLVDDLPLVADDGRNHSRESAQHVPPLACVDGTSDAAQSDFYRFTVAAGQRVACEVLVLAIRSKMDPVMRLLDATGAVIATADDDAVGPECRFSHTFATAGDYWLEVRDSRHEASGGYHLRLGDFPLVGPAFPLAVRRGTTTSVSFGGPDGAAVPPQAVTVAAGAPESEIVVAAKLPGGRSSAWARVAVDDAPQVMEAASADAAAAVVSPPAGINGRLEKPGERDVHRVRVAKGQKLRFASRTRSLGSAASLRLRLRDAADKIIAAATANETDEVSLDATVPEDGEYRLEVEDLLGRGGPDFDYAISVAAPPSIVVELKPVAATRDAFAVEPGAGCAAIDLQIKRDGHAGPIGLEFSGPAPGLRVVNPEIPAAATDARIYITADEGWNDASLALVRLRARAMGAADVTSSVGSQALRRQRDPQVPFPAAWQAGVVALAGVKASGPACALEPAAPVALPRPVVAHQIPLTIKRLDPEFKGGVAIINTGLPAGWSLAGKTDKDLCTLTLTGTAAAGGEPASLRVLAVSDHRGRSRIEQCDLPIRWFDPARVRVSSSGPLLAGKDQVLEVAVAREGADPQPVKLTLSGLPAGVTAAAGELTIAAGETQGRFALRVAADAASQENVPIAVTATSTHAGKEYRPVVELQPLQIIGRPNRVEVFPREILLDGARARQQVSVTGIEEGTLPRDWTREAKIVTANAAIATVRGTTIFPAGDGITEAVFEVDGVRHAVPITVRNFATATPTQFENEVLVALSKQSCSSGACHGSPSGKGGFRLSLRGFDAKLDELTLIREEFGRRVNPLEPEASLLLRKPLMQVSHGGGRQLLPGDEAHAILVKWIAEGARADPPGTPRCVRLEVAPAEKQVMRLGGGGRQIVAVAHFADGSRRDVSHLAAYETANPSVATVDPHGWVTARRRGEAVILVRYLEHIEPVPLMFVAQVPGFEWAAPPEANFIDGLVNTKLRELQYLPAETCTDAEFLRRVHLDVIGALPTAAETEVFVADPGSDKRARTIDRLLERDEYARFWALKWGDLLRMSKKLVGVAGIHKYHRWLEESFRRNQPHDEFVRELLLASGSTLANPPANFYRTVVDANETVETVSQLFLGVRLQCAKCHNHPFDRWTQDNYYGLEAFFQRMQKRKTQLPDEFFVFAADNGETKQPRTGELMKPWLPQAGTVEPPATADRRLAFTDWLLAPDNPFFARVEANRIWSQLFARGIVEPVDDFRDSNPPSNPALLDRLAREFRDGGFDRRRLLRTILNSRTYQASCRTNAFNRDDTLYFSHQQPRLLGAEQLLDAINQATGVAQTFGSLPAGTRATQLPAPDLVNVEFLRAFGQPGRSTVCACERADDSSLGMAITLFNGRLIHEKLTDKGNRFRAALAAGRPPEDVVRELYMAAVCRPPDADELAAALARCRAAKDVAAGMEDVCWALINSDEFVFQH